LDIFGINRKAFERLAKSPDEQIDTVGAAFVIARTAYPDLDESGYRHALQSMAERLRSDLHPGDHPVEQIEKLNRILFKQEKFKGNRHNYYEPDNSYLNRVMDRKTGIPITLSLIYTEVSRLAGLNIYGIGMPGHFIAALHHETGRILIDPFNKGDILSEETCRKMVGDRLGPRAAFQARWLKPVTSKEIVMRMLRNLKAIYLYLENNAKAFEMLHWLLILDPDAPKERLERGLQYEAMGNTDRAVRDFERYLELRPDAADYGLIRSRIENLKTKTTWVH
jgi:regulator of sirC expression with transglutaminase-like and TPR domain